MGKFDSSAVPARTKTRNDACHLPHPCCPVSGSLALREKREDCGAQFGKYSQCLQKAVGSMAQIQPSGKPDEIARQGCNILTSIMDCKNTLSGDCLSKEVLNMFNQQMDSMKANLKQIPGWDEDKCPAAKGGNGAGVAF